LTTRPHPDDDRWFAIDKFWHFSASFVTVGAAYDFGAYRLKLSSPWPTTLALGGTVTLGVSKELYDLAGPTRHFSWKDLAADAAGICVGYFAFIHRF
jgi:putative lipoprotein